MSLLFLDNGLTNIFGFAAALAVGLIIVWIPWKTAARDYYLDIYI